MVLPKRHDASSASQCWLQSRTKKLSSIAQVIAAGLFVVVVALHFGNDPLSSHQRSIPTKQADDYTSPNVEGKGTDYIEPHHQVLRFDWSHLPVTSDLAKELVRHEENCSIPLGIPAVKINPYGLGSSLHSWTTNLRTTYLGGNKVRLWTHPLVDGNKFSPIKEEQVPYPWIWRDQESCAPNDASPMTCYFPSAELSCPGDWNMTQFNNAPPNKSFRRISNDRYSTADWMAAGIEFLFRSVSHLVIQEAERQVRAIFPGGIIPPNLITVHIRWGDKGYEMKRVPIHEYVNAIQQLLKLRSTLASNVHIFLATEDRDAVSSFKAAIPSNWTVYIDQYFQDMKSYRQTGDEKKPQANNDNAKRTNGRSGLIALASLLVAMESNDFVLTTRSNWSRLMNELLQTIVDPRCGCSTNVVDLRKHKDYGGE